jgi:hypothetical protein
MIGQVFRRTKEPLSRPCAFSSDIGMLKDRFTHVLIPFVRAYIRYVPWTMGKRSFWARLVHPYFDWHAHEFVVQSYTDVIFSRQDSNQL